MSLLINRPVLLITSCINITDEDVVLRSPEKRIFHTLEAIEQWLKLAPNIPIVVCDGSSFDFTNILRENFPLSHFECLYFQNNIAKVKLQGKGYGEGEIINFALENSQLLGEADYFIKCTGKLWVENIQDCLNNYRGFFQAKAYFTHVFSPWNRIIFEYIDTRFFITQKDYYKKYFMNAYQFVGLSDARSIEHVFRDIVLENHLCAVLFKINPVIAGVGGGHGQYYKNNLKRRIKERFRQLLIQNNGDFKSLYPIN